MQCEGFHIAIKGIRPVLKGYAAGSKERMRAAAVSVWAVTTAMRTVAATAASTQAVAVAAQAIAVSVWAIVATVWALVQQPRHCYSEACNKRKAP